MSGEWRRSGVHASGVELGPLLPNHSVLYTVLIASVCTDLTFL
jgi:hypothetical protein